MIHHIKKCSPLFRLLNSLALPFSKPPPHFHCPTISVWKSHVFRKLSGHFSPVQSGRAGKQLLLPAPTVPAVSLRPWPTQTLQHLRSSGTLRSKVPNFLPPPVSVGVWTRNSLLGRDPAGVGRSLSKRKANLRLSEWEVCDQSLSKKARAGNASGKRTAQKESSGVGGAPHNLHYPPRQVSQSKDSHTVQDTAGC